MVLPSHHSEHASMNVTIRIGAMAALIVLVPDGAQAAGKDACALLSAGQVSAIVGAPMDAGTPLTPTMPQYCSFNETGKGLAGRNAHISIIDERVFTAGKTPISGIEKSPESGIGDEAYWSKGRGMVYVLTVRTGGNYSRVQSRTNKDALAKSNTP